MLSRDCSIFCFSAVVTVLPPLGNIVSSGHLALMPAFACPKVLRKRHKELRNLVHLPKMMSGKKCKKERKMVKTRD
jgi:hypothetical protein